MNTLFINFIVGHVLVLITCLSVYLVWNNFFLMLLSMELAVLSLMYIYIVSAYYTDDILYIVLTIMILLVAAIETVIALLLLINFINLNTILKAAA